MTKNSFLITAFSALIILSISTNLAFGEETAQLELEVHYTNGDIADYNSMKFVVYQDFDKTPLLTVDAIGNPNTIEVPKNHDYKVEVYVNDIYASVDYIEVNEQSEKLNINIPLSAGLKIKVYYEDGLTPIDDATVVIKSNGTQSLEEQLQMIMEKHRDFGFNLQQNWMSIMLQMFTLLTLSYYLNLKLDYSQDNN